MSRPVQELERHDPADVGPYRLLGKLGAGGMGQVYLATGPGGPVAIKLVHDWLADNEEFRNRFAREVAASRQVDGPWTARVVDADTDAPTPWLAIEYIRGVPLDRSVVSAGPLPAVSVHVLAADMARALAAIHAAGIVHRDVKPANVMLAPDRPVLVDFGIARALDGTRMTTTGMTIGTPAFMSPEQAEGLDVGTASDLFSLGSVLVHAATGQGPFGEGTPLAVLRRIRTDVPDLGALGEPVRALVERCLRRDPGDRPSAADLAAALEPLPALPREGWLPSAVTAMLPAPPVAPEAPTPAPPPVEQTTAVPEPTTARPRRISRRGVLLGLGATAVVGAGVGIGIGLIPRAEDGGGPTGPRWTFRTPRAQALASGDGVVYAGGTAAEIRALDIASGQSRWAYTTRGQVGRIVVTDGVVSVDGGAVYGLDAATGRRLWEVERTSVVAAGAGVVIALTRDIESTSDLLLVGLDAATGTRRWAYGLSDMSPFGFGVAVDADRVYFGSEAAVVALDVRSGTARWQYPTQGKIGSLGCVGDAVICVPDLVSGAKDVVALDVTTGALRWQRASESAATGLAVEGDSVYTISAAGIESWRADDGEARWKSEQGFGSKQWPSLSQTQPAATSDAVYVAGTYSLFDSTGRLIPDPSGNSIGGYKSGFALFAFSASSGSQRWILPLDHKEEVLAPTPPLIAAPGTVLVATSDAVHAVPER